MTEDLYTLEEELTITDEERNKRMTLMDLAESGDEEAKKTLHEEYGMTSMFRHGKTINMTEEGHEKDYTECNEVQSRTISEEDESGGQTPQGEDAYDERVEIDSILNED